MAAERTRSRSRSPVRSAALPDEFAGLTALVVNLDRRVDRWERVGNMLKQEVPWLKFDRISASDPRVNEIPETEVAGDWNTSNNAVYENYDEWQYDAPGSDIDGTQWKWPHDVKDDDPEWKLTVDEEDDCKGVVEKLATKETWSVKCENADRYSDPGVVHKLSPGERGCAQSHRRIWEVAATKTAPTLVLEDDVSIVYDRSDDSGKMNGQIFTERLASSLKSLPKDFDVLYLGWAGFRGGNFRHLEEEDDREFIRKAEYVWTTVAYVISPAGAKKLLSVANPINQPVDNFMAWEGSQGRLSSFVAMDKGDCDEIWAGGIVDQLDFKGDSDVAKSDGGVQDEAIFKKEECVVQPAQVNAIGGQ